MAKAQAKAKSNSAQSATVPQPPTARLNVPVTPTTERAALLIGALDMAEATGIPDARWERYQIELLNHDGRFSIDNKARQCGYSWSTAAEAIAICLLEPRQTVIFVSYNQTECSEKVRYAGQILEALPPSLRVKTIGNARTYLELANGSRIISHPGRPPRGKGPVWLYLDELAHCQYDREIYSAGIHMIQRGGRLRIGSTPLGESGMFWEILTESLKQYPGYTRRTIPWWHVDYLTTDVERATREAPSMTTEERVYEFGRAILIDIYENKPLEGFQEEMETMFIDENVAWITWEEIRRCEDTNLHDRAEPRNQAWVAHNPQAAMRAIECLQHACTTDQIEKRMFLGCDIGRKHDLTVITVYGYQPNQPQLTQRLLITLRAADYRTQARILDAAFDKLPIERGQIDDTGIGNQLAEERRRAFPTKARGYTFTHKSKEELAVALKLGFQNTVIRIIADRDQAYQIHSIKRKITGSNNVVFDVDASEEHHADIAWANALAIHGSGVLNVHRGGVTPIPIKSAPGQGQTLEQWRAGYDRGFAAWKEQQKIERERRKRILAAKTRKANDNTPPTADEVHQREIAEHLAEITRY